MYSLGLYGCTTQELCTNLVNKECFLIQVSKAKYRHFYGEQNQINSFNNVGEWVLRIRIRVFFVLRPHWRLYNDITSCVDQHPSCYIRDVTHRYD